jgi:hypothetical protein
MKNLLVIICFGLLVGCSAVDSLKTKNYSPPQFVPWEDHLSSFVGKDISQPQKRFGYNFITRELGGGKKAFIWQRAERRSKIYGNSNYITGRSNTFTCEWSFVTNDSGMVLDYQWNGNDCPKTVNLN